MKLTKVGFAFVALLLSCSSGFADDFVDANYLDTLPAQIPEQLKSESVRNFENFRQGPFSASIHGVFQEIKKYSFIEVPYRRVSLPTRYLTRGNLSFELHLAREAGQLRRAPLAIVLNPIFGEEAFHQMTRFIQFFGERGFHVAVFQSTFTDTVTEKAPTFFPGDLLTESAMHAEVIDQLVHEIGEAKVSGATLVGVSYGAFLGAIIKAGDAARKHPLINGPVLLINPPYEILNSAKNLDRFSREALSDISRCFASFNLAGILLNGFLVGDNQRVRMDERCAKVLLNSFGVRDRINHFLTSLDNTLHLALSWLRIINTPFEDYIDNIAHIKREDGQAELNSWLKLARTHGFRSTLVVASADDPINERFDFSRSYAGPIASDQFLEVPTGGHTGLRSAGSRDPNCRSGMWLDCLLKQIYFKAKR